MKKKELEVIVVGKPDLDALDKTQADIFYSALLEIILEEANKKN